MKALPAVTTRSTFKKTGPAFGLFCLLLILANCTDMALTPVGVQEGYLAKSDGKTISGAAVAHAAGEFRIVAANLLWMNVVEHYHHQYMASGGNWIKNQSILPYLRIITWLDPHCWEAYDVGDGILTELHRDKQAKDFLNEGIRNNPRTWELYNDYALYYAWYHHDAKDALPWAERARSVADDPFYRRRMNMFCHTLTGLEKVPAPPAAHLPFGNRRRSSKTNS